MYITYVKDKEASKGDFVLFGAWIVIGRATLLGGGIVCFDDDLITISGKIVQEFSKH